MNNSVNICLATDNNYAQHAGVLITSIINNIKNTNRLINIFVLNGGINQNNILKLLSLNKKNINIKIINFNNHIFDYFPSCPERPEITNVTYYKFIIPTIFNSLDKILFLDCDMIAVSNVCKLYDTNIKDYLLAGVQDLTGFTEQRRLNLYKGEYYINCGMLLINIKNFIKYDIQNKLFKYVKYNTEKIMYLDQDPINIICENSIKYLDLSWNLQYIGNSFKTDFDTTKFKKAILNPKIIHFLGKDKPWKKDSKIPFKEFYFKYLCISPWN